MTTTICYRTNNNEEYLAYVSYRARTEIEKDVENLNRNHPEKMWNGEKIDWTTTKEFFINE